MSKKKKNQFMTICVMYCMFWHTVFSIYAMVQYWVLREPISASVLGIVCGGYIFELGFLMAKKLVGIGKDENAKITHTESEGSI